MMTNPAIWVKILVLISFFIRHLELAIACSKRKITFFSLFRRHSKDKTKSFKSATEKERNKFECIDSVPHLAKRTAKGLPRVEKEKETKCLLCEEYRGKLNKTAIEVPDGRKIQQI